VHDLTTGSVTRHLLKTSGFMLVTMLFQTLYYLVDLYWVGRLGKEAVAAVGVAGNLMFISLAVTMMLGVGTTVLISHAVGSKDHDRAQLVFNQSQVLSALAGVVYLALGMAARGLYAGGLSADATTAALANGYLLWFLPAMALQFAMVAMSSALRGTGNFKPGMVVQSATVMINILLAPVLIFGWGTGRPLGVAGAAIATLIAIVVGNAWLLLYFVRPDSYLKFNRASWKPQPALWRAMLAVGLPAGAEFALMAIYLIMVYAVSRPFGAEAQAGFGIGMRVIQAGFLPVVALGFAVSPVAGQNVGARLPQRVGETFRSAVLLATSLMVVLVAVCHIAPDAMIRVFSKDPAVIAVGDEYLRIISWNFIASGVIFVSSSMFQALGNTVPALVSSLMRIVAMIPVLFLSGMPGFRLRSVWYISVVAVALQMCLSLFLLRREFRRRLGPMEHSAAAEPLTPKPEAHTEAPVG